MKILCCVEIERPKIPQVLEIHKLFVVVLVTRISPDDATALSLDNGRNRSAAETATLGAHVDACSAVWEIRFRFSQEPGNSFPAFVEIAPSKR